MCRGTSFGLPLGNGITERDGPRMSRASSAGQLRVGTSGYQYDHWRGRFYPPDLRKEEWLTFYATRFETVEINNTFYGLPAAATFDTWRRRVAESFTYALKFSRYGSHLKHLKEPEHTIGRFLERAERLRGSLGPILVQLPPRWKVNVPRLEAFLAAATPSHRWAMEFRDRSWLCDDVLGILRDHGAALCIHDLIEHHPVDVTAHWVYMRFHGTVPGGRYGRRELSVRVPLIKTFLRRGLDVFVYFNNDAMGHAVRDAVELKRLVQE